MCMFIFAYYYYVRVIFQNTFILKLGLVLLSIMHITDVRTHTDTWEDGSDLTTVTTPKVVSFHACLVKRSTQASQPSWPFTVSSLNSIQRIIIILHRQECLYNIVTKWSHSFYFMLYLSCTKIHLPYPSSVCGRILLSEVKYIHCHCHSAYPNESNILCKSCVFDMWKHFSKTSPKIYYG